MYLMSYLVLLISTCIGTYFDLTIIINIFSPIYEVTLISYILLNYYPHNQSCIVLRFIQLISHFCDFLRKFNPCSLSIEYLDLWPFLLLYRKGISKSALPYRRSVPTWLKLTPDDVKDHIFKLAKKGYNPSQIGMYNPIHALIVEL